MLRPYISEKNYWILAHHEIFQAYYYGDAMNVNKNIRDRFKDNDHFKACETFCERYIFYGLQIILDHLGRIFNIWPFILHRVIV